MVLADLEYHQNVHLDHKGHADWFQRGVITISLDIFREYSPCSVRKALNKLSSLGYLEVQRAPRGDRFGSYYRLNVERVNSALTVYDRRRTRGPSPRIKTSNFGGVAPPNLEGAPFQKHLDPLQKC